MGRFTLICSVASFICSEFKRVKSKEFKAVISALSAYWDARQNNKLTYENKEQTK